MWSGSIATCLYSVFGIWANKFKCYDKCKYNFWLYSKTSLCIFIIHKWRRKKKEKKYDQSSYMYVCAAAEMYAIFDRTKHRTNTLLWQAFILMPKTNSNFQQISIPSFEIQYFITTDHNIGKNELNGNHCSYIKFELRKKLF